MEMLKGFDFSRLNAKHKEKLWQSMSGYSGGRQLADDELDVAAAGPGRAPDEIKLRRGRP